MTKIMMMVTATVMMSCCGSKKMTQSEVLRDSMVVEVSTKKVEADEEWKLILSQIEIGEEAEVYLEREVYADSTKEVAERTKMNIKWHKGGTKTVHTEGCEYVVKTDSTKAEMTSKVEKDEKTDIVREAFDIGKWIAAGYGIITIISFVLGLYIFYKVFRGMRWK